MMSEGIFIVWTERKWLQDRIGLSEFSAKLELSHIFIINYMWPHSTPSPIVKKINDIPHLAFTSHLYNDLGTFPQTSLRRFLDLNHSVGKNLHYLDIATLSHFIDWFPVS